MKRKERGALGQVLKGSVAPSPKSRQEKLRATQEESRKRAADKLRALSPPVNQPTRATQDDSATEPAQSAGTQVEQTRPPLSLRDKVKAARKRTRKPSARTTAVPERRVSKRISERRAKLEAAAKDQAEKIMVRVRSRTKGRQEEKERRKVRQELEDKGDDKDEDHESDDDKPIRQLTREISERRELNDAIRLASKRSQDEDVTAIRESMNHLVGGNGEQESSNSNEKQAENGDNKRHDERGDQESSNSNENDEV